MPETYKTSLVFPATVERSAAQQNRRAAWGVSIPADLAIDEIGNAIDGAARQAIAEMRERDFWSRVAVQTITSRRHHWFESIADLNGTFPTNSARTVSGLYR